MGLWEKASDCLHKKKQIIEKIAANTEKQWRFIKKRKMKGLQRVLNERDLLIKELTAIEAELASDQLWEMAPGLTVLDKKIAKMQQNILDRSRQVLQQAIAEKASIAAELRKSKVQWQVQNKYVNPWAIVARGLRINERG